MNNDITNNLEFTVSELSLSIKRLIEDNFEYIRLKGEIGRVSKPNSGHIYMDIKDDSSVISGVIWKGNTQKLKIAPEEGLEVVCFGKITTYPGQSKYQIIIEDMEPAGVGALMALLEKRKEILLKEGLFNEEYKKEIPFLPKNIGVITSPSGAVIKDIIHRVKDRFPTQITIWPVRVQGESSAEEIIDAIEGFHLLPQSEIPSPDVIIIARGGGSIEDLWGFNDEKLVRKVFSSKIPIISAVGHETDTTLIDLVADLRAPTPTAAAEMAIPVRKELLITVKDLILRANNTALNKIEYERRSLDLINRAFPKISVLVKDYSLRFNKVSSILKIALSSMIRNYNKNYFNASKTLKISFLSKKIELLRNQLFLSNKNNNRSMYEIISINESKLKLQEGLLDVLSHNNVLRRGFALIKNKKNQIIRKSKGLKKNDDLIIEFYNDDKISAKVTKE
ncbi:MAG: exodeoxyribonuclease VII large subunit [Pseudomonadota bacterium]|nr:exodeoxyribonuclease VII large subunit [Pseudomonadota bacterium]